MEEMHENEELQEQETPAYTPRPAGQVWAARLGLVAVIGLLIYQLVNMIRGGF